MKIAVINSYAYASGTANSLRARGLALSLRSDGHTVVMMESSLVHERLTGLGRWGLPGLTIGTGVGPWLDAQDPLDLVLVLGCDPRVLGRVDAWCRRNAVALVVDVVDWYEAAEATTWVNRAFTVVTNHWTIPQVVAHADGVVTVSSYLKKYFDDRQVRTCVVPAVFDGDDDEERQGPATDGPLSIAYVGSPGKRDLTTIRNIEALAPSFSSTFPGVTLRVAGVEQSASAPTDPHIQWLGRLTREHALDVVRSSDFTVLQRPPDALFARAGFPSKVAESLLAGTPVIANLTSDLARHLVDGENAVVLEDDSPQALQEGLIQAAAWARSPEPPDAGDIRRRALPDFTAQSHAGRLGEFVRSCVERDASRTSTPPAEPRRGLLLFPAVFSAWTLLTFLLFTLGPRARLVTNWLPLSAFVLGVVVVFTLGFVAASARIGPRWWSTTSRSSPRRTQIAWLRAATVWVACFAILSMLAYGVRDPVTLLHRVLSPRSSYFDKFDEGDVSPAFRLPYQVLNVSGALYFVFLPLLVLLWKDISLRLRLSALGALGLYLLFYLSTGTQKGLGDVVIGLAIIFGVLAVNRRGAGGRKRFLRPATAVRAALVAGLGLAIVWSFGQRVDDTSSIFQQPGMKERLASLGAVVGPELARGVLTVSEYMSQGYIGLSYALRLPFVWTGGVGGERALAGYLPQYLGLPDPSTSTYPYRVGRQFGWSPTEKWSTVYPWIASDVTFPGVLLFVALAGACAAVAWRQFARTGSPLALSVIVIIGYASIYSVANNQLFNERWSALGSITIFVVWFATLVRARSSGVRRRGSAR